MDDNEASHNNNELEKLISILPGQALDVEVVKSAFLGHESVAVLVADDDGNYLYVNQAAIRLFGYSEKEFMLMNIRDIRMAEGGNPIKQFKNFISKGSLEGVFHFYDKSNKLKISLYRASRIADDVNLSIMIDVTYQYGIFDDILDQFNEQSDVLSNLPSISFRYNHRSNGLSMFTFVSDNVVKVLRLQENKSSTEWALGELVIDEDMPAFMEATTKSISEVKPMIHQARLRLGDGTISSFEVRSYPVKRNNEIVFYGTLYLL
jgi:PAS domain S-box-containing protein